MNLAVAGNPCERGERCPIRVPVGAYDIAQTQRVVERRLPRTTSTRPGRYLIVKPWFATVHTVWITKDAAMATTETTATVELVRVDEPLGVAERAAIAGFLE